MQSLSVPDLEGSASSHEQSIQSQTEWNWGPGSILCSGSSNTSLTLTVLRGLVVSFISDRQVPCKL